MIAVIAWSEASVSRIIRVEMSQDGCLGEGVFEGLEHLGVVGAPGERGVLACEANQGDDNVRKPHSVAWL